MDILKVIFLFLPVTLCAQEFSIVYDDIKHPFPKLDSLNVLTKKTYYYKSDTDTSNSIYSNYFSNQDSVLISSYQFDLDSKILKVFNILYDEGYRFYYFDDDMEIYKCKSFDYTSERKRILRRNLRVERYNTITYEKNDNSRVKSSTNRQYRKYVYLKGGRLLKVVNIDSSSYATVIYNNRGLPDSFYKIVIEPRNSLKFHDTTITWRNWFYKDSFLTDSIHQSHRDVFWQNRNRYGLFWRLKEKIASPRKVVRTNTKSIRITYDDLNKEIERKCWQNSFLKNTIVQDYDSTGNLIRKACNTFGNHRVSESFSYDSLNRLIKHYRNSNYCDCAHEYWNNGDDFKKIITEPWIRTVTYDYERDGSYMTTVLDSRYLDNDTTFYSASGKVLALYQTYGPKKFYYYDSQGNLVSVKTDNGELLEHYKYNNYGLIIEERRRSDLENPFEVIKTYYAFSK